MANNRGEIYQEMVRDVMSAETMLACADKLEAFVQSLSGNAFPEEQKSALAYFWKTLSEARAVSTDFNDPNNRGWCVCPQEKAVATYIIAALWG